MDLAGDNPGKNGEGEEPVGGERPGRWILFFVLAFLPVALLGLIAFRIAAGTVRELVVATNVAAARGAVDIVLGDFERRVQMTAAFAGSESFVAAVSAGDAEKVRSRLESAVYYQRPVFRVSVHDLEGILWSDFPEVPDVLGRDFSETDWFRAVLESGEPYVSPVYESAVNPEVRVVGIAVPVFERGEMIAVLLSQYRLGGIGDGLRFLRFGKNGVLFLLDPNGKVAAHSVVDAGVGKLSRYLSLPLVERMPGGSSVAGNVEDSVSVAEMVATFLPLEITGRDWAVVASQPEFEAYAPVRQVGYNIGAAGVILALVAVMVVSVLWRGSERNRILNRKLGHRNRELEELTKELERSNRELEEFAYIASHDLQEPLRMVASYTQLLAHRYEGRLDGPADQYIHYAVDGARRMQQLIQDLLRYSRAGGGGKRFEVVAFSEIVELALSNLRISIQESAAEVHVEPLPELSADRTEMVQVFQNLIGNAIKFRGKDAPRIRVWAEEREEDWVFSVEDNGVGVPPEERERIFTVFHRGAGVRVGGTGLGLPVCKKIVGRLGGRIWVDPKREGGSVFRFTVLKPGRRTGEAGYGKRSGN